MLLEAIVMEVEGEDEIEGENEVEVEDEVEGEDEVEVRLLEDDTGMSERVRSTSWEGTGGGQKPSPSRREGAGAVRSIIGMSGIVDDVGGERG